MKHPSRHLRALGLISIALAASSFLVPVQGGDIPPVGAPGGPSRPLSPQELARWKQGRALFDTPFHKSDGLGAPEMNADSCRACHQDPAIGGAGGLELNVTRMGYDAGNTQPFQDVTGGQGLSKLRPPWVANREEYVAADVDVFEQRQTPSILGAGLVDGIPDHVILANEDENDDDMDGISGVARRLQILGGEEIGRFGWKAQVPRLADFIKDAMGGECGITTPDDGRGFAMVSDADSVSDPEISQGELDDMAFFLGNLAAPQRVGSTDPMVAAGENLFMTIGCADCHIPELLGANGPVPLFSDLLCHDVMPNTYRGMVETGAPAGTFKTPPLWGIRDTAPYLHDGRAETVDAAIRAHFGEANDSRLAYEGKAPSDQLALQMFLLDL